LALDVAQEIYCGPVRLELHAHGHDVVAWAYDFFNVLKVDGAAGSYGAEGYV
jgi:hypothetical protein